MVGPKDRNSRNPDEMASYFSKRLEECQQQVSHIFSMNAENFMPKLVQMIYLDTFSSAGLQRC